MAKTQLSFDGGKKVKGRKRTILVDTMGLVLAVCVHGAGRSDHAAMRLLATFVAQFWTFLKVIWIDSTFAGQDFIAQIASNFRLSKDMDESTAKEIWHTLHRAAKKPRSYL
jgi:putative transposase